jgi:hypothetical protein
MKRQAYAGMISALDEDVGIVAELEKKKVSGTTTNVAEQHPDVVSDLESRLVAYAKQQKPSLWIKAQPAFCRRPGQNHSRSRLRYRSRRPAPREAEFTREVTRQCASKEENQFDPEMVWCIRRRCAYSRLAVFNNSSSSFGEPC